MNIRSARVIRNVLIAIGILFLMIAMIIAPDKKAEWLKEQYANEQSQFVNMLGMDVHYRIEGKGEMDILLLHGTGASLHTWEGWVKELKKSNRVITVDLPAFGLTGPRPDRDYTISSYVSFLEEFCKQIDLDTFILGGNSLGGGIAWNYALRHPDKVSALVLVDASGYPTESNIQVFKIAQTPVVKNIFKRITPKSLVIKNLKSAYGNPDMLDMKTADRYYHMALREGNRQAFIDRANTKMDYSYDHIKEISIPTLIMWGMKDTWVEPENRLLFHQDIKNSKVVTFDNLGHVPMEEDPVTTVAVLQEFLNQDIQIYLDER